MKFYVKGQTLTRCGREVVATEAVNFPNVEFEFDSSWDGIAIRTAIFQNVNTVYNVTTPSSVSGQTPYAMILTKSGDVWKTHVPYEILDSDGTLKFIVTVFGGTTETARITTNAVTCEITHSLYDPGQTPGEPTPSLWDQLVTSVDSIGTEVEDARTDTLGNEWSSLGAAIRGQINGIKGQTEYSITAIENEIEDARIDTLDSEWSSLGNAIRGQVSAIKTRYDAAIAKIYNEMGIIGTRASSYTSYENKKWNRFQSNSDIVDLDDVSSSLGLSAVEVEVPNSPVRAYIKTYLTNRDDYRFYYISGPFYKKHANYISRVDSVSGMLSGDYKTVDLPTDARKIHFHCLTDRINDIDILFSNETYDNYDEIAASKTAFNTLMSNICAKSIDTPNEVVLDIMSHSSDTRVVVEGFISANEGDILHIKGAVYNANVISIYGDAYSSFSGSVDDKQIFYQYNAPRRDSNDVNDIYKEIDIYVTCNSSKSYCRLECEKAGSNGNINGEIVVTRYSVNAFKNSVNEMNTGRKWYHGEPIYTRTYSGYYESTNSGTLTDKILDSAWNYKYTIIDCEINYSYIQSKIRNQTINPGINHNGSSSSNKPTIMVQDTNGSGHSSSTNAMLIMVPATAIGQQSSPWPAFYTVTVYYVKNSFSIAPEASKFSIISGSGSLQDTGKSMMVLVPGNSTVAIQTNNSFVFSEMVQTFDSQVMPKSSSDFTYEIGLYDQSNICKASYEGEINSESSDWNGITFNTWIDGMGDTVLYFKLRYTIKNNTSYTSPFAIGPMMLKGVGDYYVNYI